MRISEQGVYEKVSATLERSLLRKIRERTTNVSAYLNEAAEEKLYRDRAREAELELERQGVPFDEELYERLKAAFTGPVKTPRARAAR